MFVRRKVGYVPVFVLLGLTCLFMFGLALELRRMKLISGRLEYGLWAGATLGIATLVVKSL